MGTRGQTAVVVGGFLGGGRGLRGVIVAEREPKHQRGDRQLDEAERDRDDEPHRHHLRCYYWPMRSQRTSALDRHADAVSSCRRCPRLVAWREQVAREPRAAFAGERYWARPVPGFGDPRARMLMLGLAPAAHGANRTGRIFTGDRSGDFLFAALARAGIANQALSRSREDGLRLRGAWITAAVRCAPPANRPTPQERDTCLPWTVRELELLAEVRVIVCMGAFAWQAALRLLELGSDERGARRQRPRFAHGAEFAGRRYTLLGCYHPSQQNTFTGKLTAPMLDAVLARALELSQSAQPRRDELDAAPSGRRVAAGARGRRVSTHSTSSPGGMGRAKR
jgi:uracil-DNA glycosylase family 4